VDNGNVTPDVKDIYEAETYARLVATQWQLLNLHVHYKTESKLFTIKKKHPVQRLYDEAFAALAVEGE
jgi:adenylate kinase family enzyme